MYCGNCGSKVEDGDIFCGNCAAKQIQALNENSKTEDNIDNTVVTGDIQIENKTEVRVSKKVNLTIVGICAGIAIFIGFYLVGSSLTKPSNVVERFQSAVASSSTEELKNILYSNDSRLTVDETNISAFLTYFNDNPSYLNTQIQDLNNDVHLLNQSKDLIGTTTNRALSLKSVGKKYSFFPDYKIVIKPAFIEVKTGIKDVTFSLDGIEIGKSDSDNYKREFGPYIPGKYKLTANYQGKYVTLSEPHDIDLMSDNNDKVNVNLFTNVNYIRVTSEYANAKLFVNGKDTGVIVADAQNFGPLSSNTKIYATVSKEGKILKSNEYTLSNNDVYVDLSFTEAENMVSSADSNIHNLMGWYTDYLAEAVNTNNFKMVEDYLYPGSMIYNEQMSYIPKVYSQGIKESLMSFNILSYDLSDDYKSGTVNTEEVYKIYNNGNSSIKTFNYTYTFKYNEKVGSYQLDSIST